jgi:hypothetical protein
MAGMATLLGIGLQDIRVTSYVRTCLYFVHVLRLCLFKGDRLVNMVEEISRQPSIQSVAWLLLTAFEPDLH